MQWLSIEFLSRRLQTFALRFVTCDQRYDLGVEGVLCGVESPDRFNESLLLELVFDRQAKFSQLLDIAARVKLQFPELGENSQRLFQLCRIWFRLRFCRFSTLNSGTRLRDSCLFFLGQVRLLTGLRRMNGAFCHIFALVMLLLDDFLIVRDVSWVSHRSNNELRTNGARADCLASRR